MTTPLICIGLEGIKWSRFVAERWLDRPQDKPTETGNASRSKTHWTQFLCHRSLRASQRSSPLCPLPALFFRLVLQSHPPRPKKGATLGGWDYYGSTNYQGFCRITQCFCLSVSQFKTCTVCKHNSYHFKTKLTRQYPHSFNSFEPVIPQGLKLNKQCFWKP